MTGENLITPRQARAVAALLDGNTITAAAQLAGVSERQLYRWLALPVFSGELRRAEGRAMRGAGRRLMAMTERALDALTEVLDRPSSPGANVKRLAARDVLEMAARWHDAGDLEDRITALEAAQNGNPKSTRYRSGAIRKS